VTRRKVAGMEVLDELLLWFCAVKSATNSRDRSSARPECSAASKAFMVGPYQRRKASTKAAGASGNSKVYVSRSHETWAAGTPALVKRSTTFASTPQSIGLMNPAGGGGA